jgi:hypothetical protein
MMYLVSLPEIAYCKKDGDVICCWHPPAGFFFKFSRLECVEGVTADDMEKTLVIADKPIYLTKKEIAFYKKRR